MAHTAVGCTSGAEAVQKTLYGLALALLGINDFSGLTDIGSEFWPAFQKEISKERSELNERQLRSFQHHDSTAENDELPENENQPFCSRFLTISTAADMNRPIRS